MAKEKTKNSKNSATKAISKKSKKVAKAVKAVQEEKKTFWYSAYLDEIKEYSQYIYATAGILALVILLIAGWAVYKSSVTGGEVVYDSAQEVSDDNTQESSPEPEETEEGVEKKIYVGLASKAISQAIAVKENKSVDFVVVQIELFGGAHAKGRYHIKASTEESTDKIEDYSWDTFYAVQYNDVWNIVSQGDSFVACSDLLKYSFPADILYPCDGGTQTWSDELEDEVLTVFEQRYDEDEIDFTEVLQVEGNYLRGNLSLVNEEHVFYLQKSSEGWNVVFDGAGAIPCSDLKTAGFPSAMYESSCYPEYEIIR